MDTEDRDIEVVRGISQAMGLVLWHVNTAAGRQLLEPSDVYVVWFTKTLQNWKAMVSTTLKDNMYYEITYNGDRRESYLDAYKKIHNIVIKDDGNEAFPGDYIHPDALATDDTTIIPQVPDYGVKMDGPELLGPEAFGFSERKERAFENWQNETGRGNV